MPELAPPESEGKPKPRPKKLEPAAGSQPLREFYLAEMRPFFELANGESPLATSVKAAAVFERVRRLVPPTLVEVVRDLEAICEERRQLAAQARLQAWLQAWLLVHAPLSYALLALGAVHAVLALRY